MQDPAPRKLLVLDLDETLIYATETPLGRPADFRAGKYHVYRRPHLAAFLATSFAHFTVAVWTTASPTFAAHVVAHCFPNPNALAFVWASDRCRRAYNPETGEWNLRKPLDKLTRRGWHRDAILALDDTPAKWALSYGNLVPVHPWYGNPTDDELPALAAYLFTLRDTPNVRTLDKRAWRHDKGR